MLKAFRVRVGAVIALLGLLAIFAGRQVFLGEAEPTPTAELLTKWQLEAGQQLLYRLIYTGEISGSGQPFEFRGVLSLNVLESVEAGYRVWMQLEEEESSPSPLNPLEQQKLLATLQKGVELHLSDRGFQLRAPPAAGFWQSFCERTQVALPDILSARTYSVYEQHGGQTLRADYRLEEKSLGAVQLHKTFQLAMRSQRLLGESRISLRPGQQGLERLDTSIHEVLKMGAQTLDTRSRLQLQWQSEGRFNRAQIEGARALVQKAPASAAISSQLALQKSVLGTSSWSHLEQQIKALAPSEAWPQELYLKLKAWIAVHPEQLSQLLALLEARAGDDLMLRQGVKALAAVGSPEAQAVLVELLKPGEGAREGEGEEKSLERQKRIVSSLGMLEQASPESQSAIQDLVRTSGDRQLIRRARLALGTIGNRLRRKGVDPSRTQQLEREILSRLRQGSLAEQKEVLAELGNIGPSHAEGLRDFLTHADPSVRAQAYFALRFAPAPDTPLTLVSFYLQEKSEEGRKSILNALALRQADSSWLSAVSQLVGDPTRAGHALDLARMLSRHSQTLREPAMHLLAQLRDQTQDPLIRSHIASYEEQARRNL